MSTTSNIMSISQEDLDIPEKRKNYTICIVACGRMGLPHACLFAESGFKVIGVDTNLNVVNSIKNGRVPFTETGLKPLLKKHQENGNLTATNDTKTAISQSDVIAIVVSTPIDKKKKPDYSNIEKACRDVGTGLRRGSLVIVMSTVGPGITEGLIKRVLEERSKLKAGKDFGLAFSPIRATVGRTLRDIANYVRVVGGINRDSLRAASLVLKTIVKAGIIETSNITTAEAVKLFQNTYRDVNLALTNEFAVLCEKMGIDYLEAQGVANTDPLCHLLYPGIVSGHIPKDPYLLVEEAENVNAKLRMTIVARDINDDMVNHATKLVRDALRSCRKPLRRAKIAVLGISYRPNIKEPRGSRTKKIIKTLEAKGAKVQAYDPFYSNKELIELGYPTSRTLTKIVDGIDCLIIVVGHKKFKRLNLKKIRFMAKMPAAIVDLGHIIQPEKAKKEGFAYRGLGRGSF